MSEVQEKVWVVMKSSNRTTPVKVFDDRSNARAYARRYDAVARTATYWVVGVKKG